MPSWGVLKKEAELGNEEFSLRNDVVDVVGDEQTCKFLVCLLNGEHTRCGQALEFSGEGQNVLCLWETGNDNQSPQGAEESETEGFHR